MESGAQCVTITLEYQKRGLRADNLGFLTSSTTLMLVLAAALFPAGELHGTNIFVHSGTPIQRSEYACRWAVCQYD